MDATQIDSVIKLLDEKESGELNASELKLVLPSGLGGKVDSLEEKGKVKIAALKEALADIGADFWPVVSAKLRIQAASSSISEAEAKLARTLADNGQSHLFTAWNEDTARSGDTKRLMEALSACDAKYPGGLAKYIEKAKRLLGEAKKGANPFKGYSPNVPLGETLKYGDEKFCSMEKIGISEAKGAGFVLVAGGLGERLGYGGIKVALPTEITTMRLYLQHYIESILALQARGNPGDAKKATKLPLAIMTSGDTDSMTRDLLKKNNYFGMDEKQITIIKQDKVPALGDNDAKFAVDKNDKFKIQTKPHGHGDVHLLMHQSGVAGRWAAQGVKWIVFFQDTNGLVFTVVPACLGVSKKLGLEVNSLTVPRKPGEAVGAICKLVSESDSVPDLTINVEYNQLDALLKSTPVGGDKADAKTGLSPYPGNINVLVFAAEPYAKNLTKTEGVVPEFVNPKYADADKTVFKKPTRLECMMQDYPRLCGPGAVIGFTSCERWTCFSAVKNNIKDAAKKAQKTGFGECGCSGESDMYRVNRKRLGMIGVDVDVDGDMRDFCGIQTRVGAAVVLTPDFASTFDELKARFPDPSKVSVSKKSSLVLSGDVTVKSLQLDGALVVKAVAGAKVTVEEGKVSNEGFEFKDIDPSDKSNEEMFRIRGYVLNKKASQEYTCDKPGQWTISNGKATFAGAEEAKDS